MSDTPHADLLYGIEAIARHLRITPRQARHRALKGDIPTFKVGRNVCARKSSLRAWLVSAEAATSRRAAEAGVR